MSVVGSSIAGLGHGSNDGQIKYLDLGEDKLKLRWNAAKQWWISEPKLTFTLRDTWILFGRTAVINTWKYLFAPVGSPGQIGQDAFGWNPFAIRRADLKFAAGLTLQEHLLTDFWTFDAGDFYSLATVLYPMADGDSISGQTDPSSYIGTITTSTPTRRIFASTGWVNSGVQNTGGKPDLAPHLYTRFTGTNTDAFLEYFLIRHRWVGVP